jgi:hypothetical protein
MEDFKVYHYIIYIVGYIVSYLFFRHIDNDAPRTWEKVLKRIILSLGSWITVLCVFIIIFMIIITMVLTDLVVYLETTSFVKYMRSFIKEPPKWM